MINSGQQQVHSRKGRDVTNTNTNTNNTKFFNGSNCNEQQEELDADNKKKIFARNKNLRRRGRGVTATATRIIAIALVMGFMLGSAAFAFNYIANSQNVDAILGHSNSIPTINTMTSTTTNKAKLQVNDSDSDLIVSSKTVQVCKHAAWFLTNDLSSIKQVYKDSVAFFDDAGNLNQLTTYLNSHIHSSLQLMQVQFIPEGSSALADTSKVLANDVNIPGTIKDLLKKKDKKNRGGYDQRNLPGKYWPSDNPYFHPKLSYRGGGNRIDVIEPNEKQKRWSAALGPVVPSVCKQVNTIEAEKNKYEEKFMCSFLDLKQEKELARGAGAGAGTGTGAGTTNTNISKKEPCGMISIGSNGEWGFENEVSKSTECTIHTFDCTVQEPNKPENDAIHFYPFCIANENKQVEGRQYVTYSKMLEATGMKTPPALLKMDVEGFEYDVLQQMILEAEESGSKHLLPTQISVELHYATRMYDLDWFTRYRQAGELTLFLGFMFRKGGYTIVHTKFNPDGDDPIEVLFVRAFCDE